MHRVLLAVIATLGCGTAPDDPPFEVTDPTDDDEDGIADQLESQLMATFGPELRLAPDEHDWTRPANRARARGDHVREHPRADALHEVHAVRAQRRRLRSPQLREQALGQPGKILNGQDWARYGGRWGEVGSTSFTSGPPGPMFNSKWAPRARFRRRR